MNYFNQDLTQIHADLVDRKYSVQELIKATYQNIELTDKKIHAFLTLNKQKAMFQAQKVDQSGAVLQNLLAGIPIAIKDNIVTKSLKTTAASKMLANFVPIYDATVVERLAAEQMINIGKTNLDEFAMGGSTENSAFQTTRNPWNLAYVPGGSSGGSAAAIASGQIPVALGSDTGGSIRQPAAFNGIVGMKPTYGRVSRWGLIAFSSSLDEIGVLSKTVKDNAVILSVIAGKDQRDATSVNRNVPDFTKELTSLTDIHGLKIGIPKEFIGPGIDDCIKQAVNETANRFEELCAKVREISLPHNKYCVAAYYIISSSEASSNLQRFDGVRYGYHAENTKSLDELYVKSRTEGFGDEVKRRIMLGTFSLSAGYYDAYYKKAAQVRTLIIRDFRKAFEQVDLILGPVAPTTPIKLVKMLPIL
jgi:aspartyl-tRNA(Asn)/glutamyl-tRNA(Gln) amidotransferase subunit A